MTLSVVFDFIRKHTELKAMRLDSRQIQMGDLFIAMPGLNSDGRKHIEQAINNGAAAIIAEADGAPQLPNITTPLLLVANLRAHLADIAAFFYKNPSHNLKVIGITGTNGKTSTSNYIAQLFDALSIKCGIMGTLGNGFLDNLITSQLTTSDCCTLQDQLFNFTKQQTSFVAMEVSSIGLLEDRLNNTTINTAVFTNLSQDHLDYHVNMEDYFAAKCTLFSKFSPKNCVVNLDDPYSERLLTIIPLQSQIITYSLSNPNAAVYYDNGLVITPWGQGSLKTQLVGKFNISNVLAAIASCALQGLPLDSLLLAATK